MYNTFVQEKLEHDDVSEDEEVQIVFLQINETILHQTIRVII